MYFYVFPYLLYSIITACSNSAAFTWCSGSPTTNTEFQFLTLIFFIYFDKTFFQRNWSQWGTFFINFLKTCSESVIWGFWWLVSMLRARPPYFTSWNWVKLSQPFPQLVSTLKQLNTKTSVSLFGMSVVKIRSVRCGGITSKIHKVSRCLFWFSLLFFQILYSQLLHTVAQFLIFQNLL